jgi:hypothetical protein
MNRGTKWSRPRTSEEVERHLTRNAFVLVKALIGVASGLRRRERRFESCRGHRPNLRIWPDRITGWGRFVCARHCVGKGDFDINGLVGRPVIDAEV